MASSSVQIRDYSVAALPDRDYYEQVYDTKFENGGFHVYSSDGRLLYRSDTPNGAARIVGSYEGRLIVVRHVASFSENSWKLYMIDHSGNMVGTEHDISRLGRNVFYRFKDMGAGIFFMDISMDDNDFIYNAVSDPRRLPVGRVSCGILHY